MWDYRGLRPLSKRPEGFFEDGHFWIREFVLGGTFAVRMEGSGLLTVRGPDGEFESGMEPWPYRRAVQTVRADFDREQLREAVPDPADYTVYLLAPLSMGIEYDWSSLPPVLGLDVWDGPNEEYATLDVAERAFEAIDLPPVPTTAREVPARDLGPDRIDIPPSRWADDPAAGVAVRKKHGPAVSVLRDPFDGVSRDSPEPAGVPDFDAWLSETLDPATVRAWLDGDRPLDARNIETLTDQVGAELARRAFDAAGEIAMTDPDGYRAAIREWVIENRE
ncbi:MAG: hypothetical protein ABEJ60_00490 [Halodesulfurarchaeum sp.]